MALLLRFLAVLFCLFWVVSVVRSPLAVLLALTVSCVRLFRPLPFSRFLRFWLAVGSLGLRLPCARLLWLRGALRVRACLWRFRLVLVRLVWVCARISVAESRVLGVLSRCVLVWVARCWWLRLFRFLLRLWAVSFLCFSGRRPFLKQSFVFIVGFSTTSICF